MQRHTIVMIVFEGMDRKGLLLDHSRAVIVRHHHEGQPTRHTNESKKNDEKKKKTAKGESSMVVVVVVVEKGPFHVPVSVGRIQWSLCI